MFPMAAAPPRTMGSSRPPHRFGDRAALVAGDDAWTFAASRRASDAFAGHLAARGVVPGSRVAVMTTNRPEFVVAVHAISKLGAAAVLLNPAWKAPRGRPRA